MATTEALTKVLKRLRLSGLLTTLELRTKQAAQDGTDYQDFLFRVLHDEVERRDAKSQTLRVQKAGFEATKTLEDFDFTFNPEIPRNEIIDLATGRYIHRSENVVLIGKPGRGKSHIAQALGHRACMAGFKVQYITAKALTHKLRAAQADNSRDRLLKRLSALDLLIIDDLGLTPLTGDAPIDLYEIIQRRYERGSLIITSNRDCDEWPPLFRDPLLASAAMDRILHHAHVVTLEGKSYRTGV